MSAEIFAPEFWRSRIKDAATPHHAVFCCGNDQWRAIEEHHRSVLAKEIGQNDSVLDVGCAWGRLLDLMPKHWVGDYLGVDLSPEFIAEAQRLRPHRAFKVHDIRNGGFNGKLFDVAILVSVRGMVIREKGQAEWDAMESIINRVAKRLLVLEYGDIVWPRVT